MGTLFRRMKQDEDIFRNYTIKPMGIFISVFIIIVILFFATGEGLRVIGLSAVFASILLVGFIQSTRPQLYTLWSKVHWKLGLPIMFTVIVLILVLIVIGAIVGLLWILYELFRPTSVAL